MNGKNGNGGNDGFGVLVPRGSFGLVGNFAGNFKGKTMSNYNDNSDKFASSGVGTAGLTLGVIGTALASGILGGNGLGGLFGNSSNSQAMAIELAKKDSTIALLQAGADTDRKLVDVYSTLRANEKELDAKIAKIDGRVLALETAAPLREQIVLDQVNAVASSLASNTASLQASIASIQTCLGNITQCKVPNSAVCPGWGNVTITPAASTTTTATA